MSSKIQQDYEDLISKINEYKLLLQNIFYVAPDYEKILKVEHILPEF